LTDNNDFFSKPNLRFTSFAPVSFNVFFQIRETVFFITFVQIGAKRRTTEKALFEGNRATRLTRAALSYRIPF